VRCGNGFTWKRRKGGVGRRKNDWDRVELP
jgi:hypothetical protein